MDATETQMLAHVATIHEGFRNKKGIWFVINEENDIIMNVRVQQYFM